MSSVDNPTNQTGQTETPIYLSQEIELRDVLPGQRFKIPGMSAVYRMIDNESPKGQRFKREYLRLSPFSQDQVDNQMIIFECLTDDRYAFDFLTQPVILIR